MTDSDDLPVLDRGILRTSESPRLRCMIWILIVVIVLGCAISAVVGCAIPVRPIAKIETGADGKQHFIPDPEQEPQMADALPWLAIAAKALGPYGDIALLVATALIPAAVGHKVGHAKGKKSASRHPKGEPA